MNAQDWLPSLARLFPPDRLLVQPAQLTPYESDALTAYRSRPAAVVIPESQTEVVETVRLCHRFRVPFVARGSGTSLSGGSLPVKDGILIALNRLNRIVRIDPQERIAVVEPGVINLDVSKAAAPYGLYYAPDPSSQPVCTIGGNIAFNSGGAHCLKYGMTSNHVLAIEAVLPDGEVVQLGSEILRRLEAEAHMCEAEQEAAAAKRNATLGRYMLEMRHGLNNALTSILGNAELLLLEPGALTAHERDQIETVHSMAVRLHEIMQRFSSLETELKFAEKKSQGETTFRPSSLVSVQ